MNRLFEYIVDNKKTFFLKIVLTLMFIFVAIICCFAAPQLIIEGIISDEVEFWFVLPFSILMSLVLFPVAYAIVQTWRLFINIEKDNFYSENSAKRLKNIMYSGIVATVLFVGMLPSIFYFTEMDDAPGLAVLGLIFVGASAAISVFASLIRDLVLERSNS